LGGSQVLSDFEGWDNGVVFHLAEDFPESKGGEPFDTTYGGDGDISFGAEEPPPLTHTMDYYRPGDSTLCTTAECGGLQDISGANYRDISYACDHGRIQNGDWDGPTKSL